MENIIDNLTEVAKAIESEKEEEFTLFALVEADREADRWDVIVCAPWVKEQGVSAQGYGEVMKKLEERFGPGVPFLSRLVFLKPGNRFVSGVISEVKRQKIQCGADSKLLVNSSWFRLFVINYDNTFDTTSMPETENELMTTSEQF